MPLLTVNYSEPLVELLKSGFDGFDGLEIGPWFRPEQIAGYRQVFSGKPFYFHASSIMTPMRKDGHFPGRLKEYLLCTESPWLSFHLELLPLYVFRLHHHLGLRLPPPEPGRIIRQFIDTLERIRGIAGLPILLENLHSIPGERYAYAAHPEIITEIVQRTGSGFLLDLAHARVAADFQGQEVHRYLERLPLDRLVQIHVSGVRAKNGRLFDAHETTSEEDDHLLAWLLTICNPQVITLEYIREKEQIKEQLVRLQRIIAQ
jgi:uncharacterized protein (UPF0276 family)